ncbi:MAG: type II toxin-antitoxin system PemK/MazF family toxin, partial [Treponema sp.]|nr:type II toxin-antitoxin system PemK/MazF family toxin [Treponema sp.]MCL2251120.1 type II toxin-antitoxin system PemK/MazF family toxin [Treponema sp.]
IRGEIWWANLPVPEGSILGKRRPVLIIQSNEFNRSNINTIICAAITSNTELASLPGNLLLEKSVSGLDRTSTVNFSQITTIDKDDLTEQVSMLPKHMYEKINGCLKTVLEIL